MSTYSVADAKDGLPRLIDRAMAGEEVIITRHGKPVVELRPTAAPEPDADARRAGHDWLRQRREAGPTLTVSSVELLNQMYDDPEG